MTEKVCPQCKGTGLIELVGNDTSMRQCVCSYVRALKMHLGPEIASAPLLRKSPFFVPGDVGQEPTADRTRDNVFVRSTWTNLLPHLKWALGCKGPQFKFLITTDEKIRTVFVGAEAYLRRSPSTRDQGPTYNSLSDLVLPPDLVIVRLGFLGHKNVAMPGALKEALMLREVAGQATWLVDTEESPFSPESGHHAYAEDTASYIERHFTRYRLTKGCLVPWEKEDGMRGAGVSVVDDQEEEVPVPPPRRAAPVKKTTPPKVETPEDELARKVDEMAAAMERPKPKSGWRKDRS